MRRGERAPGIWQYVLEDEGAWDCERLLIVVLDRRQRIIEVGEVPAAGVTTAHVRGIFQGIAPTRVAGFIGVHGGSQSVNDAAVVKRLQAIAGEIGVPLLDHVRFRRGRCSSMVYRSTETE